MSNDPDQTTPAPGPTARWVEETVDPVTGERLVFHAATEADLDDQLAARFGTEDDHPEADAGGPTVDLDR